MSLHITTLLAGAAIGTLVVYITKDQETRKTVERFIDGMGQAFNQTLKKLTPGKQQTVSESTDEIADIAEKVSEPAVKATKPRRPRKRKSTTDKTAVH